MTAGDWLAPLAWASAALALLPLVVALSNRRHFSVPDVAPLRGTRVSILIPARDEAALIESAVRAALASRGVQVEVVVLDDQSSDDTAAIVARLAESDARVRLLQPPPLPAGWAGKQCACWRLGNAGRFEVLMFVDADVRLAPQAAAAAAARLLAEPRLGMVSGFPRQITVGLAERLVIPWIHVLLLGYLPMARMRRSTSPAYAAACGQWVVARRSAYLAVGGHGAAPASRHDGISLPRSFRAAGWATDVFDGSGLASCRMYAGLRAVWQGFGKSAGEGMATPLALPVWSTLILGGHVLPWLLLPAGLALGLAQVAIAGAIGVACNLALRGLLRRVSNTSRAAIGLHPVGAALVLAINAWALAAHLAGRPRVWRGRRYPRGAVVDEAGAG